VTHAASPQVLFQQAVALHQQGRLPEALEIYDQVIAAAPRFANAFANRGVALRRLGRLDEALESYDRALALDPASADAHANRGNVLQDLGRFEEALASQEAACRLRPGDATFENNLGNALQSLGRPEDALAHFDAALAAKPDYATAYFNRGITLATLSRTDEALASYEQAISLRPDYAEAHGNRGKVLVSLRRFDEGLASLRTAVALRPGDPGALNKLGVAMMAAGQVEAGLATFEAALACDAASAEAHTNRSLCLLTLGRYAEAWDDYERRWDLSAFAERSSGGASPELMARLELGLSREDLAGRRVLVLDEQGVGDVIMFSSMLPDLTEVAAEVALLCDPRLRKLLAAGFPGVTVLTAGVAAQVASQYERVLPIGSLGRLFRNRRADFPGTPYLRAPDTVIQAWRDRLGPSSARLRVGLSWRGGTPNTGQGERSIALADLQPLFDLPDCEFVSLQYGDVGEEVAAINEGLARPIRLFPPEQIDDFEELAGLIGALDVVVTVQTALAHVAGAVGARTLVMARRHGATFVALPWYGSVTLIRQDDGRAWAPVIAEVAARLETFTR
jgi:tetratricopeptide (TPR) repeat protein